MRGVNLISKLRAGEFEVFPPRLLFAQPHLHARIRALLGTSPGVYFEAGANDGLNQSNTAYLERYLGWRGVLVEPLPEQYHRCVRNRSRSSVFNAALVSADYPESTVEIAYANLMSTIDDPTRNLLSVDNHVATGSRFLSKDERSLSGKRITVPALTVSSILDSAGVTRLDFFSLDVEGYELEVLKGIDFNRHRPRYFLVEARNKPEMDRFMIQHRYHYLDQWSVHDFVYADQA